MTVFLTEIDAYDPALPGVRTLRYSSGTGYLEGRFPLSTGEGSTAQALDPRITFSRASIATYTDSAGVIQTAASGVPRFDHAVTGSTTNLLTWSEQFNNAAWGALGGSVTANNAIAPDGTMTGDSFIESAVTTDARLPVNITLSLAGVYTLSVYAKPTAGSAQRYLQLVFNAGFGSVVGANFDLNAGTVGTTAGGATASISVAGGGWYRCAMTTTAATSTSASLRIRVASVNTSANITGPAAYTGDGTSGFFLWGAQLEQSASMGPYVPTTTQAATLIATEKRGLLIEEGRTNLHTNSGPVGWTGASVTRTAAAGTAPDGSLTAVQYTATGTSNTTPGGSMTVTPGTAYTLSMFYKRLSTASPWVRMRFDPAGGAAIVSVYFNADTGTVGNVSGVDGTEITALTGHTPVSYGNGWWRLGATITVAASGLSVAVAASDANSGGAMTIGDSWLAWGVQFEAGAFPTSYIPTGGSAVTRVVDVATVANMAPYFGTRTNLLTYSEHFDQAAWLKRVEVTLIANTHVAPDGLQTADTFAVIDGATNSKYIYRAASFASGSSYTLSIYAKPITGTFLALVSFAPQGAACNFTLTGSGTAATPTGIASNAQIQALPNGWYRCSLTLTASATGSNNIGFQVASNTPVGDILAVWGAQLEAGSEASAYIPSTVTFTGRASTGTYTDSAGLIQTAAADVARTNYVWNGSAWVSAGLLLEVARANLIFQSSGYDDGAWVKTFSTVQANADIAPDGTMAADRLIEDSSATQEHRIGQIGAVPATITPHTYSVYVKAGSRTKALVELAADSGSTVTTALIDLTSGAASIYQTVGVAGSFTVSRAAAGWWRVSITLTPTTTTTNMIPRVKLHDGTSHAYTGNGTGFISVWGAQLEAGTSPSSYIPTTTAALWRNSDISTSAAGSITGDTGTLAVEASRTSFTAGQAFAYLGDGTTSNYIGLINGSGTPAQQRADVVVATVAQAQMILTGSAVAGTVYREALAYKANDFAAAMNGGAALTDTSGTVPTVTTLYLGNSPSATLLNGHIRRVRFWPSRLPNADLQAATGAGPVPAGASLDLDFQSYATTTVSIANGTYDLFVTGPSGAGEWRTATVSGGSYVITPPAGDSTVASYAFYSQTLPSGPFYDPRLQEPGNFGRSVFSPGSTGGQSTVGSGELVLANPDGQLDGLLDYGFDGREVRIWTLADESRPFASGVRWMTATAQQVEVSWDRVTVRLRDRLELLNKPLQTTTYAGTTISGGLNTAEGQPEDLKGRVKPLLYGEAYNIPAIAANSFDLIYQVHDGAVAEISAVYDAGAPLLFSGDYGSISALRTASIQGGYYATCKALGLFRIGASPFGVVTCDAAEGATNAARTAAQVAGRILARAGISGADLSASTVTALDAANAAVVGIWFPDEVTALDAATSVLGSVGGWLLPNRNGVFEMGRLAAPSGTPAATWTEAEVLDRGAGIERIATQDQGGGVPAWKVTVRYRRHYAVQTSSEIAGCVASARRAELASEWRTVTAENAAIKTKHLLATEMTIDTHFADESSAQAEAARLLALYSVRRDRLLVPIDTDLATTADLGRTISVAVNRWGYGAGRLMTVLGLTEGAASGVTDVEVWG